MQVEPIEGGRSYVMSCIFSIVSCRTSHASGAHAGGVT